MDGSTMGGYGSVVLVIEAFVVGNNVSVDDANDEVEVWVDGDDDDNNEDGGFGVWLTWIMKVLGLEVSVGEGVEAVGLSGFVVEVVVVVGLSIWCWWAMGYGSRFWVGVIVGRGWLQQRCGFWFGGYLSLFVDG